MGWERDGVYQPITYSQFELYIQSNLDIMSSLEFQQQFSNIYEKSFAFALKLTRNENDAKDLMQETALKVFSNIDKLQPNSNFGAWVSTIIKNNFINNYRKKIKRNLVERPFDEMETYLNKTVKNDGLTNVELSELQVVIDSIGKAFSEPFILAYQGYRYQEIAEKLSVSIGTVKSRIFFARKKIKAAMLKNKIKDKKNYEKANWHLA